jgi:NAD(P)-dependent dehydrogenase (short-subunit alcohol dehydrogenase family)
LTEAASKGAALVTGGGARIGRAICLTLADAGYDIAIHYHSTREPAEAVAAEVRACGRRAAVVQADLADPGGPAALARGAAEALGTLMVLVNNASLFCDDRFGALEARAWDAHFATNLRAPVLLAQAFAALLPPDISNGRAAVVNLLDQRVLKPNPQVFSYALSKSALWTATRMMAQALAPRVRVNGVGPGPTLASIHQDQAAFAREAEATLMGRAVTPEEIAAAVLYLVSAQAVTGQMIAVDSGQHLAWRTADIEEA